MAAAQRTKASDKQGVLKKILAALKKRYKASPPRDDRPVLETLLYSACLENVSYDEADAAYQRLHAVFHDLNEIRVSSISELSRAMEPLPDPDLRAWRIRSTLHFVFEKNFAFEFESLKKKTLDLAIKQLGKINELSAFNRAYVVQTSLGSHVVPIDDAMARACIWLGLADRGSTPEQVSEALKPVVRKPETTQFCNLIRGLATDPKVSREFESVATAPPESDGNGSPFDLTTAPARLTTLLEKGPRAGKAASNGAQSKSSRGSRARTASPAAKSKRAVKKSGGKTAKKRAGSSRG
jgi:endonuclease-3